MRVSQIQIENQDKKNFEITESGAKDNQVKKNDVAVAEIKYLLM